MNKNKLDIRKVNNKNKEIKVQNIISTLFFYFISKSNLQI